MVTKVGYLIVCIISILSVSFFIAPPFICPLPLNGEWLFFLAFRKSDGCIHPRPQGGAFCSIFLN